MTISLSGFIEKMVMEKFSTTYLAEAIQVIQHIDAEKIEQMAQGLAEVRQQKGRLFWTLCKRLGSKRNARRITTSLPSTILYRHRLR